MESLKSQKSEEEAENFEFEESGNEYFDRPDMKKRVTISVSLDKDPTFLCDKNIHSKA